MLKRLKTRREFLRVAGARRKWAAPGLILQIRRCAEDERAAGEIRVGFTVSRKVGGAVARNRARRRLRAAAEQVLTRHAKGGREYVIVGRGATVERPFDALIGDLTTALERLGARRGRGPAAAGDAG